MFQEFKQFALRGNVIDLAIGVIIGGAFGKIVSSLVSDILMPPIGILLGGVDFSHLTFTLQAASETTEAVTLNYGLFFNTLIDFIIIAFVIFFLIRQINRLQKPPTPSDPPPAQIAEEVLLLREIRDTLAKK